MSKYKIIEQHSTVGSSVYTPFGSISSAIVMIDTEPRPRVFLGCWASEESEQELYQNIAGMGNELSFGFIENLYLKMKESRENDRS